MDRANRLHSNYASESAPAVCQIDAQLTGLVASLAKYGHASAAEMLRVTLASSSVSQATAGHGPGPMTTSSTDAMVDLPSQLRSSGSMHAPAARADRAVVVALVTLARDLLEKSAGAPRAARDVGTITICPGSMRLCLACGRSVALTARQLQILVSFHDAEGAGITRSALIEKVWGKTRVSPKCLNVHLAILRRKIAPLGLQIIHQAPDRYALLHNGRAAILSCVRPGATP